MEAGAGARQMTFSAFDTWWWPYVFIAFAGWIATDIWRLAGVLLGKRLNERSQAFLLVRSIATALVAAVISRLILFPTGALAETTMALRAASGTIGFAAFLVFGQRVAVGVGVSVAILLAGMAAGY
jgi:hypothetical protein